MQPTTAPQTQPTRHPAPPAPRKLALAKETLRRLTPGHLRLVAGGATRSVGMYAC